MKAELFVVLNIADALSKIKYKFDMIDPNFIKFNMDLFKTAIDFNKRENDVLVIVINKENKY